MTPYLRDQAHSYTTADLAGSHDLHLDLCNMSAVGAGQYDTLIACDVLEHVSNDRMAMREIFRILRPGGYAILTVPQKDNLEQTYEDESIMEPKAREAAFGQFDHVRIYGTSFPQIMEEAGFQGRKRDQSFFSREETAPQVLFPPVLSSHPLATKYRKVFFGRKPPDER